VDQSKRIKELEKEKWELREALEQGIAAINLILKQEPEVEFKHTLKAMKKMFEKALGVKNK
jgi:hypothetical protein